MSNFKLNQLDGEFIQAFVGKGHFSVDQYLLLKGLDKLDILHSDIQGYELEMLEDCAESLSGHRINYLFVSTHSQPLHHSVVSRLEGFGYRVEISSDFDFETTSHDGFIFASSPAVPAVFQDFLPMSRLQILQSSPASLLDYITGVIATAEHVSGHP